MTKEVISRLIQSTNPDDVELALQFLFSYKIKEIREIIPWGIWYQKSQTYRVALKIPPKVMARNIRYSSWLFMQQYGNDLYFTPKPRSFVKYTSLYE